MNSKNRNQINNRGNIMFLLTQDLESPSGIGRYFPLSKNLVKQGLSVTIAALHSNFDSLEDRDFYTDGVHISYVAQMHVKKENSQTKYFGAPHLLWHALKATWRLFLYLLRNPADIVIIGKPHPMNSIAGLIGGHLLGAKIIVDCDDYEAASNFFSSPWQKWVIMTFENWVPKFTHHVTTNTIFNQERMVKLGVPTEKIDYLPNGVDHERFHTLDQEKSNQIVSKLNLENQKVIAYIGSLSLANHPVDLLMEAFKIISDTIENVKLLIVGGGKDLDGLKKLASDLQIKENVVFEGRVSPDLVPYYYQIADVTVDPVYDTEAAKGRCPLKMFESWAMSIPFVTADVGDRKTLAGSPPAVQLTKPGNRNDLANQLLNVLNTPDLAKKLVIQGNKKLVGFSWDNLAVEFANILKDLCINL